MTLQEARLESIIYFKNKFKELKKIPKISGVEYNMLEIASSTKYDDYKNLFVKASLCGGEKGGLKIRYFIVGNEAGKKVYGQTGFAGFFKRIEECEIKDFAF